MKLWKYCLGYVRISIMGKYPEKLVDRCARSGVRLENVQRRGPAFIADIAMRDMKRLRKAAYSSGCRVRILEKHGLPLLGFALRRNRVFAIALMLGALAAVFASTRLWFVEIETVTVPKQDVEAALAEMGAVPGAAKAGIKPVELAHVLNADPRVANAKVALRGVVLTVDIAEVPEQPQRAEKPAASGIYAAEDCVIDYISVTSGRALVKKGQAVKKGDLLISGDLSGLKEGYSVEAAGVVYGEVLREFSANASPMRETLQRSGRSRRVVSAEIMGRELFLELPYERRELVPVGGARVTASPAPLVMREYECFELVPGKTRDTGRGVKERARLAAQEKLTAGVPKDAKLISIKTACFEQSDGSVTAVLTVITTESIGVPEN